MNSANTDNTTIYTPELIDLVRIGVATAALLEQAQSKRKLCKQLRHLLPQLYAQTLVMPNYLFDWEEDIIEEYITEESYDGVRLRLATLLADDDLFLVPTREAGKFSEDVAQQTISECLADVYQHLGNLLGIVKERNTQAIPPAIGRYLLYFREYWGRQLLHALLAIHELCQDDIEDDEDDLEPAETPLTLTEATDQGEEDEEEN